MAPGMAAVIETTFWVWPLVAPLFLPHRARPLGLGRQDELPVFKL